MIFVYDKIEVSVRYRLMSQSVVPRPIAWIVTESRRGDLNIAPFSYFTPLSSNPPTLIVSIGHKADGVPKDTLRNIRETERCIVCMPSEENLNQLHYSSKALEYGDSEIERFGIETVKLFEDFPPVVKGVNSSFACRLLDEVDLKGSRTVPLILMIEKQFVPDDNIIDGESQSLKVSFESLGRDGGEYIVDFERVLAPKIP